jgi:hypothetical protein
MSFIQLYSSVDNPFYGCRPTAALPEADTVLLPHSREAYTLGRPLEPFGQRGKGHTTDVNLVVHQPEPVKVCHGVLYSYSQPRECGCL